METYRQVKTQDKAVRDCLGPTGLEKSDRHTFYLHNI